VITYSRYVDYNYGDFAESQLLDKYVQICYPLFRKVNSFRALRSKGFAYDRLAQAALKALSLWG